MKISIIIFIIIFILISGISHTQELIWKHTGGPMGGVVGDIAINSNDAIYAGMYPISQSGLFKSIDNGDSWIKLNKEFGDFRVYSIYITKEDHIWVGTDFQDRIYLSTDNGESWEIKSNGYNTNECWAFGESNDGVLFAGDGQYNRLYRSTNYGNSWTLSANLRPLVFATDSNNTVYAGTFTGLYKTTDNGITWIQDNFLQNLPIASILIDDKNNLFCGTGYYDSGDGVYYSDDGGQSWTRIGLPGMVVLSLAFDSEGNLFAGTLTEGVYKTTDLGQNWQQYQKGLHKKAVVRLKINKLDEIFIGSEGENLWGFYEGGVFRSTNGGAAFDQVGLPISRVKNVVFSGDSLIFAATPSGVQKYHRFNTKWSNIGLNKVEALSITPSNFLFAATRADGLFKSTDYGDTWVLTNLTADTLFPVYNVLALNDDTIFISSGSGFNLRRSTNGGENWDVLSIKTGEWEKGLVLSDSEFFAVGFDSNNKLYKSTDLGSTFSSIYSGFGSTNDAIRPLCVADNGYIYFALLGNNPNGIVRSTDNGNTWTQILLNTRVSTVFANNNGLVLTGSLVTSNFDTNKVYLSHDFGNSWTTTIQPTRWSIYISDIQKSAAGKFYFGTSGEGLYEVDIPTNIKEELNHIPNEFSLSQNYPNPFNPTTKIIWQSPVGGWQTLKVYDLLGREVATLVDEEKPAGNYEMDFDASTLSSGIYFYQLVAGSFTETKKMILLR